MDKGTQEKVSPELFSKEERYNIVRSFIEAYIRGEVKIAFPTKEEVERHKQDMEAIFGKEALISAPQVEYLSKQRFLNFVSIATGASESTQSELQVAISELFRFIILCRQGERIEGEFLQVPNLQLRLASLEGRVTYIEHLLEELRNLTRIRGQPP